jgi:phosphohistidine phosphatase
MKSVIIVRHAKSSWDSAVISDFDRPLNDRGKEDGPKMAKRLLDKKISIDAFISSPAKRAKRTATYFATEYGVKKEDLILVPELYHPAPEAFFEAIAKAPPTAKTIALFSHNPGITDFVNMLTEVRIDNMPTCAVFAIKTDITAWPDFEKAPKQFWFFDFPKSGLL